MKTLVALLFCAVFASVAADWNRTIALTPLGSTVMEVLWNHPPSNYPVNYYAIQYKPKDTPWNSATEKRVPANRRLLVLHGLQPATEYFVRVRVVLQNDRVMPSETAQKTTPKDKSWASIERLFLQQMQSHIDSSLTDLFLSFRMKSHVMQRPGLAKLLREESDRHWAQGFSYIQKYFQREGQFNDQFTHFTNFLGNNPKVAGDSAEGSKYSKFYTTQFDSLVGGVDADNHRINEIYRHSVIRTDPDYAHFVQEKAEGERSVLRNLQILQKNLAGLHNNGMALHLFDKAV